MNSSFGKSLVLVPLFLFAACASYPRRASVVMRLNDNEAHVGMGKGEVEVGDHLQTFKNVCRRSGGANEPSVDCQKKFLAHGEVVRVINDNYSVVKFPPGTEFSEGDTVEKHAH